MPPTAPSTAGQDTGLASIRPKISEGLPRQGIPPALASWEELAGELRWGTAAGALPEMGLWWWELRPHLTHGTLELRVPDAQTTVAEAAAVAAVAHALVVWLAERHDARDLEHAAPELADRREPLVACRHGVEGALADLATGERTPTRAVLTALVDRARAGGGADRAAGELERGTRADRAQRRHPPARGGGRRGRARAGAWLADRFAHGL